MWWDEVKRTGLPSKQLLSIGLSSTVKELLVLSYNRTTYRSRTCIQSSCSDAGELDKAIKIGVI